jgi:diguanylate cyclase (GGDEF)-like protein
MVLAVAADLSAALPGGPKLAVPFWAGTILLAVVCLSNTVPWRRLPEFLEALPSGLYIISAALTIASMGGLQTGMMSIFLVPVMWTALYQRKLHSVVIVGLTIIAILEVSIWEHDPTADLLRRVLFWGVIMTVLTIATHGLRSRLGRALTDREELLRQADALSQAAQHLTSLLQPDAVLAEACRLAAAMVSPPGVPGRRAKYFQIEGETATSEWEFDDESTASTSTYPLTDNPYLSEVVRTGEPLSGAYDPSVVGPTLGANLLSTGTTHGAWIPIAPNGVLHGVLTVSARGVAISDQLFARAVSLGHIVELALSNALALQKSSREAATDPLTGLSNRRGFELEVAHVRGRRLFAVLAIDVDDLKRVNDTLGHATGDALLVGIAEAAMKVMRRGDLLARTGGDEFAAFLVDACTDGGVRTAQRILESIQNSRIDGMVPAVSIGIACGTVDSDLLEVLKDADAAMYVAKRRGGNSYALAESALATAAAQ